MAECSQLAVPVDESVVLQSAEDSQLAQLTQENQLAQLVEGEDSQQVAQRMDEECVQLAQYLKTSVDGSQLELLMKEYTEQAAECGEAAVVANVWDEAQSVDSAPDESQSLLDGLEGLDGEIMVMMKRGDISKEDILAAMEEEQKQIGSA